MGCTPPTEPAKKKSNNSPQVANKKPAESPKLEIKAEQFVFENKENIRDTYDFSQKLGAGAYGTVYKGIHKVTKEELAIKEVLKQGADVDVLMNEVNVLKKLVFLDYHRTKM